MNTVPNISDAMATIQSLADAIESRGVSVPTEAEVMPVLSFARARGIKLAPAQWIACWRLGRDGLAAVASALRTGDTGVDLTDAQWQVKDMFRPWQAYDPVAMQSR